MGFLILLWILAFSIVFALRTEFFGQRVRKLTEANSASALSVPQNLQTRTRTSSPGASPTRLVITAGPMSGKSLSLTKNTSISIGRSGDSSLVIRDDYTSTNHAQLFFHNGRWILKDLDSTNGTFYAGSRITSQTVVDCGVVIKVGLTTFELQE